MRRLSAFHSTSKIFVVISLLVVLLSFFTSCANVSYLAQAGKGQFALWNRSKPIDEWLKSETLDEKTKTLLREVPSIKKFGENYGIKPTGNYQNFVKLAEDSVVYAVMACGALDFTAKTWSFPIVGSVPYLGFFREDAARKYADGLRKEGGDDLDVDVRGVPAYSTLGWFSDPLLSSMIPEGDRALGDLVEVVLHESLHATLYISNQSAFNESLATFVGERLAKAYLAEKRGEFSPEYIDYLASLERSEKITDEFSRVTKRLKELYDGPQSRAEKVEAKAKILRELKIKFKLRRELNNASLAQYLTYTEGTKPFQKFFEERCGADWRKFLSSLSRIKQESFAVPQQENLTPVLQSLDCS